MESPGGNDRSSWKFNSSLHSSIMSEDLAPARKLNIFHYACIGVFLAFAACTVAATIYAFAS